MKGQTKQSFLTIARRKKHTIEVQRMNEERKWKRKKYNRNVHRGHAKVVKITRSNLYKMKLFRFSFSLLLIMAHDNRSYAWFLSNTFYIVYIFLHAHHRWPRTKYELQNLFQGFHTQCSVCYFTFSSLSYSGWAIILFDLYDF